MNLARNMEDNDGFEKVVLKRKRKNNKFKNVSPNNQIKQKLLQSYPEIIKNTKIFKDIIEHIEINKYDFNEVRCLALGSFFEEIQPLYQLSLLLEIVLWKMDEPPKENKLKISLYDPVFTKDDIEFINIELNGLHENVTWVYETESEWECAAQNNDKTLYYIPHGDLHLLEYLFPLVKPKLYLGNYLFDQLLRVDDSDHKMKYLVNIKRKCYEDGTISDTSIKDDSDSFKQTVSKNKRKILTVENNKPVENIALYFKTITVPTKSHTSIEPGPWLSAFSSLALHHLQS